eukprot:6172263-Pleurochrysis_carterae.AAC.2
MIFAVHAYPSRTKTILIRVWLFSAFEPCSGFDLPYKKPAKLLPPSECRHPNQDIFRFRRRHFPPSKVELDSFLPSRSCFGSRKLSQFRRTDLDGGNNPASCICSKGFLSGGKYADLNTYYSIRHLRPFRPLSIKILETVKSYAYAKTSRAIKPHLCV